MKRPTRVTRGSPRVTCFIPVGVHLLGIHRAEFIDVDFFVVEAIAEFA